MPKTRSKTSTNIRRRGDKFQINWLDAGGERHWLSFGSRKEAQDFLERVKLRERERAQGLEPRVSTHKTFEDLVELWQTIKHAKKTLPDDNCRIKNHLRPVLGGVRLVEIDKVRLAQVERRVAERRSIGTVRQVLSLLRAMLNLAVEYEWLLRAPRVKLPTDPEKPASG